MGVVNITPDSFSDGGKFNNSESLKQQIDCLISKGVEFIDIGAESTAPFNDPVSVEDEISRFNQIFFQ